MRPRTAVALTVLCLGSLVVPPRSRADDQFDSRRFGGRGLQHGVLLLLNEPVQKELEITPDQWTQLAEMQAEYSNAAANLLPKPSTAPGTPEQWEAYNRQSVEAYSEAWKQVWPRAEKTLSETQKERLQEILVQCRGPAGVDDPWANEHLMLTQTQKKSLAAAREKHLQRLQNLMAERDARAQDDIQKSILEMEKERDADILLVLTRSQRSTFEAMKGPPIDLGKIRNGPFANGVVGPGKKSSIRE